MVKSNVSGKANAQNIGRIYHGRTKRKEYAAKPCIVSSEEMRSALQYVIYHCPQKTVYSAGSIGAQNLRYSTIITCHMKTSTQFQSNDGVLTIQDSNIPLFSG